MVGRGDARDVGAVRTGVDHYVGGGGREQCC